MFSLFKKPPLAPPAISPVVDLRHLTCDDLQIGKPIPQGSQYLTFFVKDGKCKGVMTYKNEQSGMEISITDNRIDSFFISLKSFKGKFMLDGQSLEISTNTTETDAASLLGDPWWKDVTNDLEVIDFYELNGGTAEIQFEYPAMENLMFITVLQEGVLSNSKNRESYKVTKSWPPTS